MQGVLQHQRFEFHGDAATLASQPAGSDVRLLVEDRGGTVAGERRTSGQHGVQNAPECVDVGALVGAGGPVSPCLTEMLDEHRIRGSAAGGG